MQLSKVELVDIGKKFEREWLFRHFSFVFEPGQPTAIVGANGSGKSTLMRVIAAALPSNEGKVIYRDPQGKAIDIDQYPQLLSWAAPYLRIPPDFTLDEVYHFHHQFKPLRFSHEEWLDVLNLRPHRHKALRFFSSGMRQKVQLSLALFSNTPLLLLDEPTMNLDKENAAWYKRHVLECIQERIVIISSNEAAEYDFCTRRIRLTS
jgi:ABC-type multidrug transport system ATPase subunit